MKFLSNKKFNSTFALLALTASALLSACGQNTSTSSNLVNNVNVSTSSAANGDQYINFSTSLTSNSFFISGAVIPVVDPDTAVEYGALTIESSLCSPSSTSCAAVLAITLNITQVAKLSVSSDLLPNGTAIPVYGITPVNMLALNVGNTGAKLYIDLNDSTKILGVALPFKELDGAGKYVAGTNVFASFVSNNVGGIAGVFAGSSPNQTGIALFANITGLFNHSPAASHYLAQKGKASFWDSLKMYNALNHAKSRVLHLQ